jgi:nucleoid-associated protein YgaU
VGLFDFLVKKKPQEPKFDFSNVSAGSSSVAAPAEPAKAAPKKYTVAPGDSLWKIAKRSYGDGNQWKKIYEANRQVIGSNPDLIKPGQVLVIPD